MRMQPPKHLEIPYGATHWAYGFVYGFLKIIENRDVYLYVNDEWIFKGESTAPVSNVDKYKLEDMYATETAKEINTIFGVGKLLGIEDTGNNRYIVDLDDNPFGYRPAFLYEKDIIA